MRMRVSICPLTYHDDTWERPTVCRSRSKVTPVSCGETQGSGRRHAWGGSSEEHANVFPSLHRLLFLPFCFKRFYSVYFTLKLLQLSCHILHATRLITEPPPPPTHLLLNMNQGRKVNRPAVCHEWEKMENATCCIGATGTVKEKCGQGCPSCRRETLARRRHLPAERNPRRRVGGHFLISPLAQKGTFWLAVLIMRLR